MSAFNSGDVINISPGLVITLQSNLPTIGDNLTINGNGSTLIGAVDIRGLTILAGTVNINGLTFRDGDCQGGCMFPDTTDGGAIFNVGTLTLTNTTFIHNSGSFGGAILNVAGGTLTVVNSTFTNNHARMDNTVGSGAGGAIYNGGGNTNTLSVTASTFFNNSAESLAGALYNDNNGSLNVINSTFSNNSAPLGGGIYNDEITAALSSSTFSANVATTAGGGGAIFNHGALTLANSIIANTPDGGGCAGTALTSIGNNIVDDGTCIPGVTRALTLLDGLADNGGTTQTQAIQPGSAAIGVGSNCPPTDQRGLPRKPACDLGAFETQPPDAQPTVMVTAPTAAN